MASGSRPARKRPSIALPVDALGRGLLILLQWLGAIGLPIFVVSTLRYAITGVGVVLAVLSCELARVLPVVWKIESHPASLRSRWHMAWLVTLGSGGLILFEWFSRSGLSAAARWPAQGASEAWSRVIPLLVHVPTAVVGLVGLMAAWRWRMNLENRRAAATILLSLLLMCLLHAVLAWLLLHRDVLNGLLKPIPLAY